MGCLGWFSQIYWGNGLTYTGFWHDIVQLKMISIMKHKSFIPRKMKRWMFLAEQCACRHSGSSVIIVSAHTNTYTKHTVLCCTKVACTSSIRVCESGHNHILYKANCTFYSWCKSKQFFLYRILDCHVMGLTWFSSSYLFLTSSMMMGFSVL